MDLEFPRIVYRAGGEWLLESGAYSVRQVADADELAAAQAEGWHLDQYAAKAADEALVDQVPADDTPPTRAELEAKATELGIKWDGRWGDKRLSDAIAAKLKG